MAKLKNKVANFGVWIALCGILSCVLYFADYNLRILAWIDLWGPLAGWGIRLGCIVVGIGLFYLLGDDGSAGQSHQAEAAHAYPGAAPAPHPRTDPRFAQLERIVAQQYGASFDPSAPYRIAHVAFRDHAGNTVSPADPHASSVSAFLIAPHNRLMASLDLRTGAFQALPVDGATWSRFVPAALAA